MTQMVALLCVRPHLCEDVDSVDPDFMVEGTPMRRSDERSYGVAPVRVSLTWRIEPIGIVLQPNGDSRILAPE